VGAQLYQPTPEEDGLTDSQKRQLDRLADLLREQPADRLEAFWTDVMAQQTLSETILAIMQARGITPYALGKAAGVNATVIQRFVNGERGLTLATADKVVKALGLILVEKPEAPKKKK
jgi:DNA-binding phage protein